LYSGKRFSDGTPDSGFSPPLSGFSFPLSAFRFVVIFSANLCVKIVLITELKRRWSWLKIISA
jgi:hypothetical protein